MTKLFPTGNVRLAELYFDVIIKNLNNSVRILDVGCGDGVLNNRVRLGDQYCGVDLGTGNYERTDLHNVTYYKTNAEVVTRIQSEDFDLGLLINVLEHTENFSDLFSCMLKAKPEHIFVALPNEGNLHNRLGFLLSGNIVSHDLSMHGKHLNLRHLWLIDPLLAKNILNELAKKNGYTLVHEINVTPLPNTVWKRILYKTIISVLSTRLSTRNFGLLYKKDF